MALKATVYKVDLQVADMDRNCYGDYALTVAQHPSETLQRMMLRILIFALHADEQLSFTKGLSSTEEPDLWNRHLHGGIAEWIELGQPDEKRVRKAAGLADQVTLYCYSGSSAEIWWKPMQSKAAKLNNLKVVNIAAETVAELARLADKNMQLQCSIQDGTIWLGNGEVTVEVVPQVWQAVDD
ncbi:MAG: YaeQ family protein [Gammaproteobacteria bacterium]|nr:YaeQ family protein [Gammaproteobacteria bacterium]